MSVVVQEVEVRAYSPYDAIDAPYHAQHPNANTSTGTDPTEPGIASTFPKGTRCIVPGYNNDKPTLCDDTGAFLRHRPRTKIRCIEIRLQSEDEATKWGVKKLRVRIIYP